MAIALNLTMPLKQDEETRQKLEEFAATAADTVQPVIDAALRDSEIVHFARLLVIDNQWVQVITEFDGDPVDYSEFFRQKLGPVFQFLFSLVEGAPPWEVLNNPDEFQKFTNQHDLKSLGRSTDGDPNRGYLFSATGDTTVREIKAALGQ
jgi:hypothetical protein